MYYVDTSVLVAYLVPEKYSRLAIAQRHGCGLLTLDRVLADSGNRVGLPTKWLADPSRPSH